MSLASGTSVAEDVERVVGDPTEAHTPGCYALVCEHPESRDALEGRWADTWETDIQQFAIDAYESPTVVYVGASGDVYDRLVDHSEGEKRRSGFLSIFPPSHLLDVWPMDDPFSHEGRVAFELKNDLPGAFVYSDAIR